MQAHYSRLGKIGASEISGLVREYAPTLLEKNIINQEIHDKLMQMPAYLETRYSLAHKLSFDQGQLDNFQNFIENEAMKRGKLCEEMVMQQFMNEHPEFKIIDSQVRIEKRLKDVSIPLISTLDYIIANENKKYIHECKTTDISIFYKLQDQTPFHYQIQLNMQMFWNEIEEAYITIAGVQSISKGRGKEKTYQILEHQTQLFKLEPMIIDAIKQSVFWFDFEIKNNKKELFEKADELKTKSDLQMDSFLEDYTATKEEIASTDLSEKIRRVEELKIMTKELKTLEEDLKAQLKKIMGHHSRKLKVIANDFELNAKYTKPSFFDEVMILEEIKKREQEVEEARQIDVGMPKSKPSLRIEIKNKTN